MAHLHQRRAHAKRPPSASAPDPSPSSSSSSSTTTPRRRARAAGPLAETAPPIDGPGAAPAAPPKKRANGAGSVRLRGSTWTARLSLGEAGRVTLRLPTCRTEAEAEARRAVLVDLAGRLLAAGQIVLGLPLLERAAAREGRGLRDVTEAIDVLCRGDYRARASADMTFGAFAEHYLSGELAEQHPDHVRKIKSVEGYRRRLAYVLPILGPVPLVGFTLEHADYAMSQLPRHLEPGTRRNVAKVLHRILSLAAYPAKIIKVNPLPRGWLPKKDEDKAKGYLYPDEEARLIGHKAIRLGYRVFYGFMAREGMRSDEAGRLEWQDIDLDRGAVRLDKNKTDDPRAWALSPDVVRALRIWQTLCPSKRYMFVNRSLKPLPGHNGASQFRAHLQRAGIDRPELFEQSALRLRIRLHDLRATFITIKLANGRTETWIADRTGHKSSDQINNYRRGARTVAELGLGDFAPMDEAIPELRDIGKGARRVTALPLTRLRRAVRIAPLPPTSAAQRASTPTAPPPSAPRQRSTPARSHRIPIPPRPVDGGRAPVGPRGRRGRGPRTRIQHRTP